MWLMTRYGFYSVVENRDDKNAVLIRARARADLERLCDRYGKQIEGFAPDAIDGPDRYADYRWRLWVKRDEWKAVVADLTDDIDYENFKNAVKKVDKDRAERYMSVWSTMYRVQTDERDADGKPYVKSWADYDREGDWQNWREEWDDGDALDAGQITLPDMTDDELYAEFLEGGGQEESDGR